MDILLFEVVSPLPSLPSCFNTSELFFLYPNLSNPNKRSTKTFFSLETEEIRVFDSDLRINASELPFSQSKSNIKQSSVSFSSIAKIRIDFELNLQLTKLVRV
jgi:hypothetical protein